MSDPLILKSAHGSASILPERGRVLQIETGGHEAFWNPPEVTAAWNLGGERLWLGPEASWFWKMTDKVDFDHYQVPPGLDPDTWQVGTSGVGSAACDLKLHLASVHSGNQLDLALRRRFELLADSGMARGTTGIGLRISTTLEIIAGTQGQPVDLWSIVQVPFGGKFHIPAAKRPEARNYFAPCPDDETVMSAGVFTIRVGGAAMFKIGINPCQSAGRMAYVRQVEGGWLVLTRSFPLHPALSYCDAPLDAQGTQGDAAQFFNDGGMFGSFGEMEHRSPALICGQGPQSYTETTITTLALLDEAGLAAWQRSFV